MINIGGWMDGAQSDPLPIRGGLIIPLYFVVLSLMGGAVSLARRVPEIQKRSEATYTGTAAEPKLSPEEVREYLVFQIMQFVSAPLIAVTAYYLVAPGSPTTSVVLGFSSGFASEAILLMIRGAVEKVSPAIVLPPASGAASGQVRRGGAAVANAQVRVVGEATLKTQTDATGAFVINGIPSGEQVIEASDTIGTKLVRIVVEAGKATLCPIDL